MNKKHSQLMYLLKIETITTTSKTTFTNGNIIWCYGELYWADTVSKKLRHVSIIVGYWNILWGVSLQEHAGTFLLLYMHWQRKGCCDTENINTQRRRVGKVGERRDCCIPSTPSNEPLLLAFLHLVMLLILQLPRIPRKQARSPLLVNGEWAFVSWNTL